MGLLNGHLPDIESIKTNTLGTIIGIASLSRVSQDLQQATPQTKNSYQQAEANIPGHVADSIAGAEFASAVGQAGASLGHFVALSPDVRLMQETDGTLNRSDLKQPPRPHLRRHPRPADPKFKSHATKKLPQSTSHQQKPVANGSTWTTLHTPSGTFLANPGCTASQEASARCCWQSPCVESDEGGRANFGF